MSESRIPSSEAIRIPTEDDTQDAETFQSKLDNLFERRINRPVSELDYAPTEREGLIRLGNIPKSFLEKTESVRGPEEIQREMERLNIKADTIRGGGIPSAMAAGRLEARPVKDTDDEEEKTEPARDSNVPKVTIQLNTNFEGVREYRNREASKNITTTPFEKVGSAFNAAKEVVENAVLASLFGKRPLTEEERAGLSDEEIKRAEAFKIAESAGAISANLDALNFLASTLGSGLSEVELYVLSLTPLADTLVGRESLANIFDPGVLKKIAADPLSSEILFPKLVREGFEAALDNVLDFGADYTAGTSDQFSQTFLANQDSLRYFTEQLGKKIQSEIFADETKEMRELRKNFFRGLGVPAKDMNTFYASLAVAGAFAPLGFMGAVKNISTLGVNSMRKGVIAAKILKGTEKGTAKSLPFKQILQPTLATTPMPTGLFKLIEGTQDYKDSVERIYQYGFTGTAVEKLKKLSAAKAEKGKFTSATVGPAGVTREQARDIALSYKRDTIAALGAGAGATLFANYFPEMGEEGEFAGAILGALSANKALTKTKDTVVNLLNFPFILMNSNATSRAELFAKLAEKKNQKLTVPVRSALLAMGYKNEELRQLRQESFDLGDKYLRDAAEAVTDVEKQKILEKGRELGILNSRNEINETYHISLIAKDKLDRKTMAFAATFWKNLETLPDVDKDGNLVRDNVKNSLITMFSFIDDLATQYPKQMKPFTVLLENAAQLSILTSLRQSLITKGEFSSKLGGFVAGSLVRDIEKYSESLIQNTAALKSVVDEIKGTPEDVPNILKKLATSFSEETITPYLKRQEEKIKILKEFAASKQSKSQEELAAMIEDVKKEVPWVDITNFDSQRKAGQIQTTLLDNKFTSFLSTSNKRFEDIKDKYSNVSIDLKPALEPTDTLEEIDSPIRAYLRRFGEMSPSTARGLEKGLTQAYFKDTFGIDIVDDLGNINPDSAYRSLVESLSSPKIFKGTREEAQNILQEARSVIENRGEATSSEIVDRLFALLEDKIDIPAKINVTSFMSLRSELTQRSARQWKSRQWARYNDTKERIDALDDILSSEKVSAQFATEYAQARNFYRDNVGRFNDPLSPLYRFKVGKGEEGQEVASFELFDKFLTAKNPNKAASDFRKLFYDSETGQYSEEAIDQLMYAFGKNLISDYSNMNYSNLHTVLLRVGPSFKQILEDSGNGSFLTNLSKIAQARFPEKLAKAEDEKTVHKLLVDTIDRIEDVVINAFQTSAIQRFSQTDLDKFAMIFRSVENTTDQIGDMLLSNYNKTMNFPVYDAYISMVKRSSAYANLNQNSKKIFDRHIKSPEFRKMLNDVSNRDENLPKGFTPMSVTILEDVKRNSPEMYPKAKAAFRAVLMDKFSEAAFPAIKSFSKTTREFSGEEKTILQELARENNTSVSDIKLQIGFNNIEIVSQLRRKVRAFEDATEDRGLFTNFTDRSRLTNFTRIFKFNLNNELDPIAMQSFFKSNQIALKEILDKEHYKALEDLMQLSIVTGSKTLTETIGNLPAFFTTQMGLGRGYNAMKGMVSWRYLAMEKLIVDYRHAQASVMRQLLSNKEVSIIMRDVLSKGVFKPRQAREALSDMFLKLAPLGVKLKVGSLELLMNNLEKMAGIVSKEKSEEEREARASEPVEQVNESGVPLGFEMGGQGFSPRTGEFYDITEELPD